MVSTCIPISQELQWIFEAKISLHEVRKSINSQANNKSAMVQQQSYKYFFYFINNKVINTSSINTAILLNVYDSLEKIATMDATSRTWITSVIYKFRL